MIFSFFNICFLKAVLEMTSARLLKAKKVTITAVKSLSPIFIVLSNYKVKNKLNMDIETLT